MRRNKDELKSMGVSVLASLALYCAFCYFSLSAKVVLLTTWAYLFLLPIFFCLFYFKKIKITPSVLSLSFAIILLCAVVFSLDVIARPIFRNQLYYRAHNMFVRRWPPLPLLHRYPPNLNYRGKTYGDLSAIIGKHSFAEDREEIFKTDSLGFRNGEEARKGPIDILLISDSFGAGIGTSQNKILSSVLRDKYDRATYNLSMPGSPWEGMKNLAIESSNISIRENAMVLWTFFMANDMDDLDLISDLEAQPQYSNIMGRALVSFSVFRNRSVIRQLLRSWVDRETSREFQKKVVGKDFLNGKKMLFWEHYAQKRKLGVDYWIGHPSYRKLVATFDQMKHLADLKGLKVVVLALPSKEEVYSWVLDGGPPWSSDVTPSASSLVLEKLSSLFGFTFFDAKAGLILESKKIFEASGSVLWWYDDTHWNEQGHAVIADIIDKEILWSLKGEFQ